MSTFREASYEYVIPETISGEYVPHETKPSKLGKIVRSSVQIVRTGTGVTIQAAGSLVVVGGGVVVASGLAIAGLGVAVEGRNHFADRFAKKFGFDTSLWKK